MSKIIGIVVTVILFFAFLGVIANQVANSTTVIGEINETIAILQFGVVEELANDDLVSGSVVLINITNPTVNLTIPSTNYTVDNAAGTVNLTDTSHLNASVLASYDYRPTGFLSGATAVLVSLIIIFLVIGMLFSLFPKTK